MASAQDGTFPAEPFLRLIRGLAPRPDLGANRLGLVWALPQAKPKLHTTLGQSCQPCEAKFSFQKTGPHSQEGSQPFVWKNRGLLVLTSSSPCSPVALHPTACLRDQFQGINCPIPPSHQEGWQDSQPLSPFPVSDFLFPHKLGTSGHTQPMEEWHPPRGNVSLLQQAVATA